MRLKPLNDCVVIRLDEDEWVGDEKSVGVLKRGLIVAPDYNAMKKRANTAEIVSVGSKCKEVKSGDKIIFRRPSLPVGEFRLIIEEQILGVIDV